MTTADFKDFVDPRKVTARFEFDIGDAVVVRGTNIDGYVQALLRDATGEQYQLAYWYNGARFVGWVFAREIMRKPK